MWRWPCTSARAPSPPEPRVRVRPCSGARPARRGASLTLSMSFFTCCASFTRSSVATDATGAGFYMRVVHGLTTNDQHRLHLLTFSGRSATPPQLARPRPRRPSPPRCRFGSARGQTREALRANAGREGRVERGRASDSQQSGGHASAARAGARACCPSALASGSAPARAASPPSADLESKDRGVDSSG